MHEAGLFAVVMAPLRVTGNWMQTSFCNFLAEPQAATRTICKTAKIPNPKSKTSTVFTVFTSAVQVSSKEPEGHRKLTFL